MKHRILWPFRKRNCIVCLVLSMLIFSTDKASAQSQGAPFALHTYQSSHMLTDVGGKLFFIDGDSNRCELWRSDGTVAGTVMIKDSPTTIPVSAPVPVAVFNNALYFSGYSPVLRSYNYALGKSDGTPQGTDFMLDPNLCAGSQVVAGAGGWLYYAAWISWNSCEIRKYDGASQDSTPIKSFSPYIPRFGSDPLITPCHMTDLNGILFFMADDGIHGAELWKSDGTTSGTVMVTDISTGTTPFGPRGSGPSALTPCGDLLFFNAGDPLSNKRQIWRTDGTPGGTIRLTSVTLYMGGVDLADLKGRVYFYVDHPTSVGLWASDGTTGGTELVKALPASSGYDIIHFKRCGDNLFFAVHDSWTSKSLWVSDGTTTGTRKISNSMGEIGNLVEAYGWLYFLANDGGNGLKIWESDGTPGHTRIAGGEHETQTFDNPSGLCPSGDYLYFNAVDHATKVQKLWAIPVRSRNGVRAWRKYGE